MRHVRPKLACGRCSTIVQVPAPSRPIERGLAGPGLLAHVAVSKYLDHLPLYRQSEIYARQGIDLDRSTLADWIGGIARLVTPLAELIGRYVVAASKVSDSLSTMTASGTNVFITVRIENHVDTQLSHFTGNTLAAPLSAMSWLVTDGTPQVA